MVSWLLNWWLVADHQLQQMCTGRVGFQHWSHNAPDQLFVGKAEPAEPADWFRDLSIDRNKSCALWVFLVSIAKINRMVKSLWIMWWSNHYELTINNTINHALKNHRVFFTSIIFISIVVNYQPLGNHNHHDSTHQASTPALRAALHFAASQHLLHPKPRGRR